MPAKAKVNWLAVRTYYLTGRNINECAEKFEVSKRQIERRRSSEAWAQERRSVVVDASLKLAERVKADIEQEMSRQSAVLTVHQEALDHEAFLGWAVKLIRDSEVDLASITDPRSKIESRKSVMDMVDRATRLSRLVRGIRDGDRSTVTDPDASALQVFHANMTVVLPTKDYSVAEESA